MTIDPHWHEQQEWWGVQYSRRFGEFVAHIRHMDFHIHWQIKEGGNVLTNGHAVTPEEAKQQVEALFLIAA